TGALPDGRVLHGLAEALGIDLALPTPEAARAELGRFRRHTGGTIAHSAVPGRALSRPPAGQAVLASWRMLLDEASLQDGEVHLAGTARRAVARLSAVTAAEIDAVDGDELVVRGPHGSATLPLVVTAMADGVVWVPMRSTGSDVRGGLGAAPGAFVSISRGTVR
ncbi:MAG: NADH-quinone oxidoreductase subunit G, partial [Cryobacterium sp.]|nr:NADH-quinone oxidoreductase subunit G [Cryobacterium sp.]